MLRTLTIIVLLHTIVAPAASPAGLRDRLFDADWRFFRGDAPGAESPEFDDSQWRRLDVPHDWSVEDLPPKTHAFPELEAVAGEWRFHPGDDLNWKSPDFDDRDWERVKLPDNWERHSGHTNDNVYGWFRRNLQIPPECRGRDFDLLLGRIDDVDEVWLNGERVGGTGCFPPDYRTAYNDERRYRIRQGLVRGDGSDVLAVRVFDGNGEGGMIAAGKKSVRVGPFDTLESANAHFTGHTVGGIGWYRKAFTLAETNRQVTVRFDGVYMNAEVWINGHRLGEHPHGYTSFEFDLTDHLAPAGRPNILAVRARNEGRNSRWYSGSGIYRHVWLTVTDPIHIPTWGVFVTTPQVSKDKALVKVAVEVRNRTASHQRAIVRARVRDARGRTMGVSEGTLSLVPNETRAAERLVEVRSPNLWSPDSPTLYSADVEVIVAGNTVDAVSTAFGIRTIEVDAERGFCLNGRPMKLKGGCLHHDNGPLGAAAIDRAEERRVELLKANGFNAVRSSHNPPSSAFLDACDRLGLLVIDEAFDQWNEPKENNRQDYHRFFKDWSEHDIAAMVRRDRNHPSVIMWSIGNEIPEQFRDTSTGRRLRELVLSHDPTRLITQAICNDWGRVTRNWDRLSDPAFLHLDVAGYNYLPERYESDHTRHPDRVILGTESYPKEAFRYWSLVEKHPWVIGDFVWTAMDYLGESGLAHSLLSNEPNSFFMPWPWFNAWCGDLDLCGFKKPQSFYRDVLWRRSAIEMLVHAPIPPGLTEVISAWGWPNEQQCWNWAGHEGTPLQVSVYSRCDTVRLELNGKVIAEKPSDSDITFRFTVPYAPGELRAIALNKGREVARTTLKTTGKPHRLELTADRSPLRADRNDLAYITVEVVDANGARVPDAKMPVRFAVTGAGELAGHASAVPNEPASFRAPVRETFQGRCLAILRPTGEKGTITLRAEADGIEPGEVTIAVRSR
ncbi:MAG TPA: glycoside hydrolase family 2 TIM barrel-domain containing protein [Verrucomicrobiota bacterium]|nr:glycoside hydrolase family 2 TIM barrel-domain containing protein [Verrucomicrobiota bacterium]